MFAGTGNRSPLVTIIVHHNSTSIFIVASLLKNLVVLRSNSSNEPRPRRRFHSSASASERASHSTLFDSPCPLQTATAPETHVSGAVRFVRAPGIGPGLSAWKADVIPLDHARIDGDSSMKRELIPVIVPCV